MEKTKIIITSSDEEELKRLERFIQNSIESGYIKPNTIVLTNLNKEND